MKHVTFGDKALFVGDEAADTLLEYARLLSDTSAADMVTLRRVSTDGNTVEASFLLNANTVLMVESTNSELDPPENGEAIQEMRERIDAIARPLQATTEEEWDQVDEEIADAL